MSNQVRWLIMLDLRMFAHRLVPPAAIAVVALLLAAGGATGQPSSGAQGMRTVGPSPAVAGQLWEAEQAQRRERRASRAGEAARRERERSRRAYEDLATGAAMGLARAKHPQMVTRRRGSLLSLPAGQRVGRYLGDFAARIEQDGSDALVESMLPLRTLSADGVLAPVDHGLVDTAAGFAPRNPLARAHLPARLTGPITFSDIDIGVSIAAAASTAPGEKVGGAVFYANGALDTDFVIAPAVSGAEIFAQLRSERSPQTIRLRFDLPREASIRAAQNPADGVRIERDGILLATISAPKAWDADGVPVSTRYHVSETTIALEVDHRGADLAYPIMVDPYIFEDFRHWRWGTAGDNTGWSQYSNVAPGVFELSFFNWIRGLGLYAARRTGWGVGSYPCCGQVGEWVFQAPREAYIYQAEYFDNWNDFPQSCTYMGIFSPRQNLWPRQYWWKWGEGLNDTGGDRPAGRTAPYWDCPDTDDAGYNQRTFCVDMSPTRSWWCDDNTTRAAGSTYAVFGTQIPGATQTHFTNYLGGALFYEGDRDDPTTAFTQTPAGWTNDTNAPITAEVNDRGLGAQRLLVTAPTQPDWNGRLDTADVCRGDRHHRCATRLPRMTTVANLADGMSTLRAEGWDPAKRRSTVETKLYVDRAPPRVEVGGELYDDKAEPLTGDAYQLWVEATDENASGPRAGVRSIEVSLRRQSTTVFTRKSFTETPCPEASCPGELTWELLRSDVGEGTHDVRVTVLDWAGNKWESTYTITVSSTRSTEPGQAEAQTEPSATMARSGIGGCVIRPQYESGSVTRVRDGVLHGDTGEGFQSTVWLADGSYEVTHCDILKRITQSQLVALVATPDGEHRLAVEVMLPVPGTPDMVAEQRTFLAPTDPGWIAEWPREKAAMLSEVLPPTP
jgi:hypothetical protein